MSMAISSTALCSKKPFSSTLLALMMILHTFLYLVVDGRPSSTIRMALSSLHF
jgi:hypothetical protein